MGRDKGKDKSFSLDELCNKHLKESKELREKEDKEYQERVEKNLKWSRYVKENYNVGLPLPSSSPSAGGKKSETISPPILEMLYTIGDLTGGSGFTYYGYQERSEDPLNGTLIPNEILYKGLLIHLHSLASFTDFRVLALGFFHQPTVTGMIMQMGDIEFEAKNNFGGEVGGPNEDGFDTWEVIDKGLESDVIDLIIANLNNTIDVKIMKIFIS